MEVRQKYFTALKWIQRADEVLVVAGSLDGKVLLYSIAQSHQMVSLKCCGMRIGSIAYFEVKNRLLVSGVKGSHL